jgi:hypothetical protein
VQRVLNLVNDVVAVAAGVESVLFCCAQRLHDLLALIGQVIVRRPCGAPAPALVELHGRFGHVQRIARGERDVSEMTDVLSDLSSAERNRARASGFVIGLSPPEQAPSAIAQSANARVSLIIDPFRSRVVAGPVMQSAGPRAGQLELGALVASFAG